MLTVFVDDNRAIDKEEVGAVVSNLAGERKGGEEDVFDDGMGLKLVDLSGGVGAGLVLAGGKQDVGTKTSQGGGLG